MPTQLPSLSLHPACRVACALLACCVVQFLAAYGLGLALAVLSLSAAPARHSWLRLMRRSRWLLLSLVIVLSWSVAGTPLWTPDALSFVPAPTVEGLHDGALQALRLVITLGIVALLLATTPVNQLISGMRLLMMPLASFVDVDRFVVRLALALEYGGERGRDSSRYSWRDLLAEPADLHLGEIRLTMVPLTFSDGLLGVFALILTVVIVVT